MDIYKKKRFKSIIIIICIFLIFISATVYASELRLMVAASLQQPLKEIKNNFESKNPDYKLELNFAGSQALFTQLRLGVKADLFLSANYYYLKQLINENIITQGNIFAQNEIIVVFNSETKKAANLEELFLKDYSIIIAEESVPVGSYTLESLDKYFNSIKNQKKASDLRERFKKSILSKEFDVKSVLNKIKLGAADAGFVYLSDYQENDNLKKLDIPKKYNIKANYYIGITKNTNNRKIANEFMNYILSSEAQAVLNKYNFKVGENIDG